MEKEMETHYNLDTTFKIQGPSLLGLHDPTLIVKEYNSNHCRIHPHNRGKTFPTGLHNSTLINTPSDNILKIKWKEHRI